ncbi:MAG: lytic transglycosylase domain-containing protein [Alphaproteobacteria bacterium]|jgi:hypothetical protein|nr:lytic transglycosylase domain-containing protein [Alphaproteobacteria bacterium]
MKNQSLRHRLLFIGALLAPSILLPGPGGSALGITIKGDHSRGSSVLCRKAVRQAEQRHRIPAQLLSAVSIVESGRWSKARREVIAWPWTVHAEGRGRYLKSKAAAVAEVKRLKARGIKNIDVGCMQVNLRYHPKAFRNLEQAFEPKSNVAYAARFLADLQRETRSWTAAVGRYHSKTPKYNLPYRQKVQAAWRGERRRAAAARRVKVQARVEHRASSKRRSLYQRRFSSIGRLYVRR